MSSADVLDLLGIEISPARIKCALLSLETLQGALGPAAAAASESDAAPASPAPASPA
jgi:NifU-like protein involved in Fe-S cluster formation